MMRLANIGRWLSLLGAALGALGLLGWLVGSAFLTRVIPGEPPMTPNAAVGLLLIGLSAALQHRRDVGRVAHGASILLATFVFLIGASTLVEYIFVIDLGIDQVLIRSSVGPHPGRPSPITALSLTLLSAGVFAYRLPPIRRLRPAEWLAVGAGMAALIGLMGHLFGAAPLYRLAGAPVIGVALPTAISLLLTTVGLLFQRPDAGVMGIATSTGPGGVLFRRLVLPALLAPVLFGVVIMRSYEWGGFDDAAIAVASFAAMVCVGSLLLLPIAAVPLDRAHAALEASRTQTRALVEQASDAIFVANLEGRYVDVNQAACRLLGMTQDEIIGKTIVDFIRPEEVGRLFAIRDALKHGGSNVAEWQLRHKSGSYIWVEVSDSILPDGRWQGIVRDISARKAAEEEAQRAKARIEGIISIASDAIIAIDERRHITIFNEGAEHIFGWSHDEALGQPLDILLPERYRVPHRANVAQFAMEPPGARRMAHGQSIVGMRKDGSEFPAEAAISKLQVGGETTFTVVLRDMTERVTLENELREARRFLENVLESSTEYSVVALDLDRRVVLWNEGARRIYGYSSQEISGTCIDDLHMPTDVVSGLVSSLFARALNLGTATCVLRERRKDGSELFARMAISRRVGPGGTPVGYLVISSDITREYRREAHERLLLALGQRLIASLDREQILDSTADLLVAEVSAACCIDLTSDLGDGALRTRRVAHRDPAMQAMCTALETMQGDPRRVCLSWGVVESGQSTLRSHVTPQWLDSIALDEEHRTYLRRLAPVSLLAVPLQAPGRLLGTLTLISSDPRHRFDDDDVTFAEEIGRRLASALENVRLYEVAEKAISARDEVLRVVAHDLRNPLSTAVLAVEALSRPTEERRTGVVRQTQRIKRALDRANRLINDLLDISRIESGGIPIEPHALDASALAREVVDMFGDAAAAASVALSGDVSPDLPPVLADEQRIIQVLGNLIGNALKFTPAGGKVNVSAERSGTELEWVVSDSGPGLPPDQVAHVFDPFWQACRTDRRGAGLGLAIAKGIVDAHHGRIWVDSEPGHGCRFHFTLPIAPELRDVRREHAQTQHGP